MLGNTVFSTHIGLKSNQILQTTDSFSIRGITSRGVFLAVEKWIIFLSNESYCGPLTINIPKSISANIAHKDIVTCSTGKLIFNQSDLIIDTTTAGMYSTPQITFFENEIIIDDCSPIEITEAYALNEKMTSISHALKHRQWEVVASTADAMFGCGTGLTPEGDDLILGIIYALQAFPSFRNQTPLQQIIQRAYQKTTTLSANLIECAAEGLVDERIHAALKAILTHSEDQQTAVQNLLGWGNSSGEMVLAGMLTVLQSMLNSKS